MNRSDYTYLLNKPDAIEEQHTDSLGRILDEFPYFQSARALRLKGLFVQNSFKYNYALKVTASHTTDRSVLFDFITSDSFLEVQQKPTYTNEIEEPLQIVEEIQSWESVEVKKDKLITAIESSILSAEQSLPKAAIISEAVNEQLEVANKTEIEKLDLGKPLNFTEKETHSFQEWLQLSKTQPIVREENLLENIEISTVLDEEKQKKLDLIDKFIEANPKILPAKQGAITANLVDINKTDTSYLMTETLARVYLEQKKYQKAIQAYEILILKYPEKSSFFADCISEIEILQHNNK